MRGSSIVRTSVIVLLFFPSYKAFAYGGCTQFNGNVDLSLHPATAKATASAYAECLAANGTINFGETYSATIAVHQVSPSVDYVSTYSATGQWIGSLDAPAEYSVKTCYQGSLSANNPGGASRSWQSTESCTPDPPPPGNGCDTGTLINPSEDCSGGSPIVINMERGNYLLTGADSPVTFDIRASGSPIPIGWTAAGADEAFLFLDRNANGIVDSGAELFGNATALNNGSKAPNGFVALAEFDGNHDGTIDEHDAIWPQLRLWRDLNHDGISQQSEIEPIAGSTVAAIGLDYHWTGRHDSSGNSFRYKSKVWIADAGHHATPHSVYDIFFVLVR
jgi:hypothetical protein